MSVTITPIRECNVKWKRYGLINRPKSELEPHKASIEAYFREHPPASIAEAAQKIYELTGIKRGPAQVRNFLKSIGMSFRKVGGFSLVIYTPVC